MTLLRFVVTLVLNVGRSISCSYNTRKMRSLLIFMCWKNDKRQIGVFVMFFFQAKIAQTYNNSKSVFYDIAITWFINSLLDNSVLYAPVIYYK